MSAAPSNDMLAAVDKQRGLIHYIGSVDERMHSFIIQSLLELNKAPKVKRINFLFSTEGGECDIAFAIFDLLAGNRKPVNTIATGLCASAGTLILQAGAKRLATPNSRLWIHYGVRRAGDHATWNFLERDHQRWIDVFHKRSRLGRDQIAELHKAESPLFVEESVKLGLLDGIITSVL